ncbi:MAG TPA: rod shape-determining protein [Candidatus Babeliales bacterium]|nr:rod shape-determining protein [Candidatus Babeliales bacterium]
MESLKKFIPSRRIFGVFSNDLAIDLGTANTLIYVEKRGVILDEPSVVAVKAGTNHVLAAGRVAKEMLGKTPESIIACRPLRDGVIADFELAESMLRYFIRAVHNNKRFFRGPRMVIGVPSGITQVECRAVRDSAEQAGARPGDVYTITESLAAAIGAGLPVHDPCASMIIDIGGGTTEVAVISLKNIVFCKSIRVGGDEMDRAIVNYVKRKYNLLIGERTAENIKINIGSVMFDTKLESMAIKGRDLISGVPKTLNLTSAEVNEALLETIRSIVDVVRVALENTPPELAADLVDRGIVMAGGGSLLRGLDKLLSRETGLPVRIADEPLLCVVKGAGKVLKELDFFKEALMK